MLKTEAVSVPGAVHAAGTCMHMHILSQPCSVIHEWFMELSLSCLHSQGSKYVILHIVEKVLS